MTALDFITALFYRVDNHLYDLPKHPHVTLWPSEVVTLGRLHALKGVGNRAFYRWLIRDYRALFPRLPERTRLKLCQRGEWEDRILVETVLSMLSLVCHFKKVMHRGWA